MIVVKIHCKTCGKVLPVKYAGKLSNPDMLPDWAKDLYQGGGLYIPDETSVCMQEEHKLVVHKERAGT